MHIIGKDILRFHAAIWPGMLLSAKLPLPKAIFVHGFITVDGEKMSKTVGNIVDPVELVKKYGTDAARFYLLREIPSYGDGNFSYEKFEQRYNGELANGLGNLVSRVVVLGEKLSPLKLDKIDAEIKNECERVFKNYEKKLEEIRLNEALGYIWELISFADRYINNKKPWELKNEELKNVIVNASYLIGAVVNLLEPFLPDTSEKIRKQILFNGQKIEIKKSWNLFPRI